MTDKTNKHPAAFQAFWLMSSMPYAHPRSDSHNIINEFMRSEWELITPSTYPITHIQLNIFNFKRPIWFQTFNNILFRILHIFQIMANNRDIQSFFSSPFKGIPHQSSKKATPEFWEHHCIFHHCNKAVHTNQVVWHKKKRWLMVSTSPWHRGQTTPMGWMIFKRHNLSLVLSLCWNTNQAVSSARGGATLTSQSHSITSQFRICTPSLYLQRKRIHRKSLVWIEGPNKRDLLPASASALITGLPPM